MLAEALSHWTARPSVPALEEIEGEPSLRQLTDQILFRFMKLQDCLGERLVPATLDALAEPYEAWPMRDRIDRLERLGYLDVGRWLGWRELRNRLAHEYPDAPQLRHAQLLAAIAGAAGMVVDYRAWAARLPP